MGNKSIIPMWFNHIISGIVAPIKNWFSENWFSEEIKIKRGVLSLFVIISLLFPYLWWFKYNWEYSWFHAFFLLMMFIAFQIFCRRTKENKK